MESSLEAIGQRLAQYMKAHKIGVNQLGRLMASSGPQVLNILNGRKYGTDKLLALFRALPDISPLWLLFGVEKIATVSAPNGLALPRPEPLPKSAELFQKLAYLEETARRTNEELAQVRQAVELLTPDPGA